MVHSLLLTWDRAIPRATPAIVYKFLSAHDLTISIQPLVHTFLAASATYKIIIKLISALYYSIIHEIIYCKRTLESLKKADKFLTFSYKWLISLTDFKIMGQERARFGKYLQLRSAWWSSQTDSCRWHSSKSWPWWCIGGGGTKIWTFWTSVLDNNLFTYSWFI